MLDLTWEPQLIGTIQLYSLIVTDCGFQREKHAIYLCILEVQMKEMSSGKMSWNHGNVRWCWNELFQCGVNIREQSTNTYSLLDLNILLYIVLKWLILVLFPLSGNADKLHEGRVNSTLFGFINCGCSLRTPSAGWCRQVWLRLWSAKTTVTTSLLQMNQPGDVSPGFYWGK